MRRCEDGFLYVILPHNLRTKVQNFLYKIRISFNYITFIPRDKPVQKMKNKKLTSKSEKTLSSSNKVSKNYQKGRRALVNISFYKQILNLIPFHFVINSVKKHNSDHYSKGITTYVQMVSMIFCQFSNSNSLREIEFGMHSTLGDWIT